MDGGDSSPRLQRQASCSCAPSMSRGYIRGGFGLAGDDDEDDDFHGSFATYDKVDRYSAAAAASAAAASYDGHHARPTAAASARGCGTRLRGLWRRIVREKKRILLCSTGCVPVGSAAAAAASREPYDAYSYAQNFDDGAAWVEPENLSRSFSARFAVPSRVLQRVAV